jgi:protein-disulfide isomerase
MASKNRKRKSAKRRSRRSQNRKQGGLSRLALIGIVLATSITLVAAIALLDQEGASEAQTEQLSRDKSLGAQDAPVVVVEYGDYQCPYCKQFADGPARQLVEDYVDTGQVRFVYRHLAFLGSESAWAAEAAECANEQGRFWDYHDKLFEEQRAENSGALAKDYLKTFATELGLDIEQFNQCLDSDEYRSKVREESNEAQRRQIRSTPSLLVNGQLIRNGANYQVLRAAIEAALAGQ